MPPADLSQTSLSTMTSTGPEDPAESTIEVFASMAASRARLAETHGSLTIPRSGRATPPCSDATPTELEALSLQKCNPAKLIILLSNFSQL